MSDLANPLRNEFEIELAGEKRVMRASFTAVTSIEKQLGKIMVEITSRIANGDLSVTDAAYIIFHGLRGYEDRRLSLDQVGEAVLAVGLSNISMAVVEFVSMALNGVSVGKPSEPNPAQ